MWCQLKEQAFSFANSYPVKAAHLGGTTFIVKTARAVRNPHHRRMGAAGSGMTGGPGGIRCCLDCPMGGEGKSASGSLGQDEGGGTAS